MALEDYLTSSYLLYVVGVIVVVIIVWFIIKNFKGGRVAMEKQEIEEDKKLLRTDREIRDAAEDEKTEAFILRNLLWNLETRASNTSLNLPPNLKELFDYIINGLSVLVNEGKSVLEDKKVIADINNKINGYLSYFNNTNDNLIQLLIKQIKERQNRLFKDIIMQDELLRRKFGLLRKEAQETAAEEGAFDRAA